MDTGKEEKEGEKNNKHPQKSKAHIRGHFYLDLSSFPPSFVVIVVVAFRKSECHLQ